MVANGVMAAQRRLVPRETEVEQETPRDSNNYGEEGGHDQLQANEGRNAVDETAQFNPYFHGQESAAKTTQ